jgi:phage head maturation protease
LYPNKECYDEVIAHPLKTLVQLRKTHAYGELREHSVEHNCIGFVRIGDAVHPHSGCVVLISNADVSLVMLPAYDVSETDDVRSIGTHEMRMQVGSKWVSER